MTWFQSTRSRYWAVGLASAILGFLLAWPVLGSAQDKKDTTAQPPVADASKDLAEQIRQLNAKVARLEAAVSKTAPAGGGAMPGMAAGGKKPAMGMMDDGMMGGKKDMAGMGMGMKDGDEMMEMMEMMKMKMKKMMGGMSDKTMSSGSGGMAGMSSGGGGMGMMDDDMDMMGMGSMGGAKGKKMKMAAALPGFPGASHIYHIGASDFYLDHPEHITLSTEQKTKLSQMKQKATMEKASAQRKIEEAEQQLWELTAADQPDAAKMDAKIREVEKFRGDQRMAFIRSVGESAQVLTDEQRKILIGQAQPATLAPHPAAHPATTAPTTPKTP